MSNNFTGLASKIKCFIVYFDILNRPGIVGDLKLLNNTLMKTKKHSTEVKNRAAELLIELQKIILHYGQSYKQLHSTNGYVSPIMYP